jgi:hypothetical protein
MAKLISSASVLFVRDEHGSAQHYRDAMGFRFDRFYGDPPSFVVLSCDGLHIMLKSVSDHSAIAPRWHISNSLWDIYFWAVEALFQDFRNRGAKIDFELCDQPYGCREFGVQDIDGRDVAFGRARDANEWRSGCGVTGFC